MELLSKRFWSKVDKRGLDDCWLWTGAKSERGYGRFLVDGKNRRAHRVAVILSGRIIPDGQHALHHCDNPPCVNPHHLFIGTDKDNIADMRAKGRAHDSRCEGNSKAKLTAENVRCIRNSRDATHILAARFGVTWQAIYRVRTGKSWRSLQ